MRDHLKDSPKKVFGKTFIQSQSSHNYRILLYSMLIISFQALGMFIQHRIPRTAFSEVLQWFAFNENFLDNQDATGNKQKPDQSDSKGQIQLLSDCSKIKTAKEFI